MWIDPEARPTSRQTDAQAPRCRALTHADLPALTGLETEKWEPHQAATAEMMAQRIEDHPNLCLGAFCGRSGLLLSSLFMRPVAHDFWRDVRTWRDCLRTPVPERATALFGISLSSRCPSGVQALLRFFWPQALHAGYRRIYLGSPVPGLRAWVDGGCGTLATPERYVTARRGGQAIDPQLRYYQAQGFKDIVCVKTDYFGHAESLDVGVILGGTIPLSGLCTLWKSLPLSVVQRMTARWSPVP